MDEINERSERLQPAPNSLHRNDSPWLAGACSRWRWALFSIILLVLLASIVIIRYANSKSEQLTDQQTLVLGQTRFAPGSAAALRVVVRDLTEGEPLAGADISVSLEADDGGGRIRLFEGQTDQLGTAAINLNVPEDAPSEGRLIVETNSALGHDQMTQRITVQRTYKLLLTSDKPLYQPGQTIHMRALALDAHNLTPAQGEPISFLVEDPQGNKIFRQNAIASEYGIASADLTLAGELIHGDYRLSVTLGDTTSAKTVEVKRYVLPKFGVTVNTDRSFYTPGETVAGTVQAAYFFDKPVVGGQVQIIGAVYDVERVELLDLRGETDAEGSFAFRFDLPDYFVGSRLEAGQADFALEVTVTDQAEHTEQTSSSLPIARDPILIEAAPEGGRLLPGVKNVIYLLTSYPDGRPARTTLSLSIGDQQLALGTGVYGLAEFIYEPPVGRTLELLQVTAVDESGRLARAELLLSSTPGADTVLLRPDRAIYQLGDTMRLEVLTSADASSVYLDIVKAGQTLSTRAADVEGGRAEVAVDLTPDFFGTLELHAYKVQLDGTIIRDSRIVVVDTARGPGGVLDVNISADKDTYRPGDTARIRMQTSNANGPTQSALGLTAVDESVFALQRQDPGFLKLYFLLEKELREPRAQILGFDLPTMLAPAQPQDVTRSVQDKTVRAAWADVSPQDLALVSNTRQDKLASVEVRRERVFRDAGSGLALPVIAAPVLILIVTISGLRHSGVLGKALKRFAVFTLVLMILSPCLLIAAVITILFGGGYGVYSDDSGNQLVFVGILWLAAMVGLGLYAWRRNDDRTKMVVLLNGAWVALMGPLIYVVLRSAGLHWYTPVALLTYLVGLAGLTLFGVGLWLEGARGAGFTAISLAILLAVGSILAAASPTSLPDFIRAMGDPRLYAGPVGWMTGCGAEMEEEAPRPVAEEPPVEVPPAEGASAASTQAPRLRQYFPETLYWAPELVTDQDGSLELEIPLADSITTWRLSALAHTQRGELGFATYGIRVFQDFFIDLDLPAMLTQGDEIAVPVAVFNYLSQPQQVRLEIREENWFDLRDDPAKELTVAPNDVEIVFFRIGIRAFGQRGLTVTAHGERASDAIQRTVWIVPDGKEIRLSESGWLPSPPSLQERARAKYIVTIPENVVPDTARVEIKVYPGVLSQVVEGLEKILRLPSG